MSNLVSSKAKTKDWRSEPSPKIGNHEHRSPTWREPTNIGGRIPAQSWTWPMISYPLYIKRTTITARVARGCIRSYLMSVRGIIMHLNHNIADHLYFLWYHQPPNATFSVLMLILPALGQVTFVIADVTSIFHPLLIVRHFVLEGVMDLLWQRF